MVNHRSAVVILCLLNRGVHAYSWFMDNQGKMGGNLKICSGIQGQLILAGFIYLRLSL